MLLEHSTNHSALEPPSGAVFLSFRVKIMRKYANFYTNAIRRTSAYIFEKIRLSYSCNLNSMEKEK